MLKRHAQLFEGLFTASDLLVVSLAWVLSYWLRFSSGLIPVEKGIPPFSDYLRMLIFVWPIWAFVFRRFQLYRPMRGVERSREIWNLVRANTLSVLLLLAVTYLFREKSVPFSRMVFAIFWPLSTFLSLGSRALIRGFLREMRRRGYNIRYVLIVGYGELAKRIARSITTRPEYGYELIGCLSDLGGSREERGFAYESEVSAVNSSCEYARDFAASSTSSDGLGGVVGEVGSFPVVGDYSDLPELIDRGGIDQILVAMPFSDHRRMESVIADLRDAVIDVRIVPDFHRFVQLGSQVEEFDGLPVVSMASTPLSGFNRVKKRIMDLVVASVAMIPALPIIALGALLIKLTSRGPIFFVQERVGLDGRKFNIYKLRTMYVGAESSGARFAVAKDPRVMPLGRFMRRYNIDELPQLFNVISGQMSLVGPRPERPVFIEQFRQHFPRYMLRHKVQAGITGWAQVNGWRGNTSIERRIEHDLYYIENWSLWLDFKILLLTLLNSFRDRNAY